MVATLLENSKNQNHRFNVQSLPRRVEPDKASLVPTKTCLSVGRSTQTIVSSIQAKIYPDIKGFDDGLNV